MKNKWQLRNYHATKNGKQVKYDHVIERCAFRSKRTYAINRFRLALMFRLWKITLGKMMNARHSTEIQSTTKIISHEILCLLQSP